MSSPVLCYVDGACAYFTTQALDKQWGDDWNDAPYEHNAGEPYRWRPEKWDREAQKNVPNDEPSWDIIKVFFDGPWETPCEYERNSPWAVQDINAGLVPWLATDRYTPRPRIGIPAGTKLTDFIRLVQLGGGDVYLKAEH